MNCIGRFNKKPFWQIMVLLKFFCLGLIFGCGGGGSSKENEFADSAVLTSPWSSEPISTSFNSSKKLEVNKKIGGVVSSIISDTISKKSRANQTNNLNNVISGPLGGKATVAIKEDYSFPTEEDYPVNLKVDGKIIFDGYLVSSFSMHGEVDFEYTYSYPYPGKTEYSSIFYVGISFRDSSGVYKFVGVIKYEGEIINGEKTGTYYYEINGDTYSGQR
jgi:hypothetical protein